MRHDWIGYSATVVALISCGAPSSPGGSHGAADAGDSSVTTGGLAATSSGGGSHSGAVSSGGADLATSGGTTSPGIGGQDQPAAGTAPSSGGGSATTGGTSSVEGTGGSATGTCPPVCGPDYESFYDNANVATIRIDIAAEELNGGNWLDVMWQRRNDCRPFDLVRTTFTYESPDGVGNVTLSDVGMRLRGHMDKGTNSLQGFKLDFQKPFYEATAQTTERRRFGEINRLNVLSLEPAHSANSPPDASHMNQCLAEKALRDFGVPAARCNHLKVYVQGQYYGLMENVEEVDHGRYLIHHYGTNEGLLVEASPSGCDYQDSQADLLYKGAKFTDYANPARYHLERGTAADAEASLIPMFQCGDATQTPDDQTFSACIQEWIDVEEWLRLIAAESIMPELESLMYDRNVYLYFRPDAQAPHGGRFVIYVWDVDSAFSYQACNPSNCDPFTSVSAAYRGQRLALVTRLTTVFRSQYCTLLNEFLDTVYQPALVDDMANTIAPAMASDPVDTQQAWQQAVSALRSFIQTNGSNMRSLVAAGCGG